MSDTASNYSAKQNSLDPVEMLRRAEFLLDVSRKVSGLSSLDEILVFHIHMIIHWIEILVILSHIVYVH